MSSDAISLNLSPEFFAPRNSADRSVRTVAYLPRKTRLERTSGGGASFGAEVEVPSCHADPRKYFAYFEVSEDNPDWENVFKSTVI